MVVWVIAGELEKTGCIQRFLGEQIARTCFIHCEDLG